MLMESMNAAPRPWTLLPPPSGGVPAGGGELEPASCGEGTSGFSGLLGPSWGKRSSAMIYLSIIRLPEGFRGGAEGYEMVPVALGTGRARRAKWYDHCAYHCKL